MVTRSSSTNKFARPKSLVPDLIYDPPMGDLVLLHKDKDLLVIEKPSGLLSVPGKANHHKDSLETRLRAIFPETLLVHRLDLPTSGVMVFARNAQAQRHLGLQFEKRQTQKTYKARVQGTVSGDSGHINLPLIADWPNRPRQKVCFESGKPSQTDWEVIDRESGATRLKLFPRTGRSHQLRVHCQAIGHPILGDRFYADEEALSAADRLQLHAETLRFRHPSGGEWVTFESPCPF